MALDAIQLDSEVLALELLPEVERAFGIALEGDLGHVRTAGDLFDAIAARRPAVEARMDTETGMAFYALRRALAPLWREENPTPLTALGGQELPLPRRLKKTLARQTGWEMPRTPTSMFALLVAVAFAAGALYELAMAQPVPGLLLVGLCAAAVLLDPGEFTGDWTTLGSLAREVTNLNFAPVADGGTASWRAFAEMLARYARSDGGSPVAGEITRETLLRFG